MDNNQADSGALSEQDMAEFDEADELELIDVDEDELLKYVGGITTFRERAVAFLTEVLKNNLVWYVAGLVDGLILLKLFGG